MIGNDLAALLVWQSNYMTPYEAFAFGLLMVYAAKTIFMSCRCGVHACFGSCSLTAFFFFGGGRAIHFTYMQRKKPQASNGRPFAAKAASYRRNLERAPHFWSQNARNLSCLC